MTTTSAREFHPKAWNNTLSHQDLINTQNLRIYPKSGIGETSTIPTGYLGLETNTFLNTVEVVGLMVLPAQLLIESTLSETEPGQIWTYLHKLSSIAKPEGHVMEVTQPVYINMVNNTVSQRKHAKLMLLRTQINSVVQISKNVWTALLLKEQNPETKATVGPRINTQFGKSNNSAPFLAFKRWKLKFTTEAQFPAESTPLRSSMPTLEAFSNK